MTWRETEVSSDSQGLPSHLVLVLHLEVAQLLLEDVEARKDDALGSQRSRRLEGGGGRGEETEHSSRRNTRIAGFCCLRSTVNTSRYSSFLYKSAFSIARIIIGSPFVQPVLLCNFQK